MPCMKTGGILSRLTGDIDTTTGLLQMALVSPAAIGLAPESRVTVAAAVESGRIAAESSAMSLSQVLKPSPAKAHNDRS